MKKIMSVLLALIIVVGCCVPAFAVDQSTARTPIPVILISGDGDTLADANGNPIYRASDIFKTLQSVEGGNATEAIANVLLPFLIEGVAFDEWDNYYAALEKEIGDLFANVRLDENGEVTDGSGISQERKDYMQNCINKDKKDKNGTYGLYDYRFWYDWRLDPLETADKLYEYVQAIKKVTGHEKVGIVARCLGTSVMVAYISKYGVSDLQGVGFNGSVAAGAEIISESISGKFHLDLNAIERVIDDLGALGMADLDPFIKTSIELLDASGVFDAVKGVTKEYVYYKIVEGVTSAIALSTFFTWPSYWAAVSEEDYDDAIYHVFGEEDSEKYEKYEGLIGKLDNYDKVVRNNLTDILLSIKEDGANVGVISKYGFQIVPIVESYDAVADQFASVNKSSFGATTSTVYDTLTDKQIEGKGAYISPDKQIDASTCVYPEYTWFVKGSSHSNWSKYENDILAAIVSSEKQLGFADFPYSQFAVYNYDDDSLVPMTEENCHTENWVADKKYDEPDTLLGRVFILVKALLKWFAQLFELVSGEKEFGGIDNKFN